MCHKNHVLKSLLSVLVVVFLGATAQATTIQPVGVTVSSQYNYGDDTRVAINTIDGSGLEPGPDDDIAKKHNQDWRAGWISDSTSPGDEWIIFDLGDVYTLTAMHVWNSAERGETWDGTHRGVRFVDVYADNNPTPTTFVQQFELQQAPNPLPTTFTEWGGGADYIIEGVTYIFTNPVQARYVMFDILSSWGAGNVGLAEVRFIEGSVPEPASVALICLGGFAMLAQRKRRIG